MHSLLKWRKEKNLSGSRRRVCSICCNAGSWWKVIRAGVSLEESTRAPSEQGQACVHTFQSLASALVFCSYKICLDLISAHVKPASEFKWSFVLLEDLWRKAVGLPWIPSSRKAQPLGYQLRPAARSGPHGDLVFSSQACNRLSPLPRGKKKKPKTEGQTFLLDPPAWMRRRGREGTLPVCFPLLTNKGIRSAAHCDSSCRWKCNKWMELLVWVN